MIIYLCGPINGCSDTECNDWRTEAKQHFPETLDPMRRDYRGKEGDFTNEIVELDKRDIDDSDVVLANCPKPSVGTSMEIFYAWDHGKFIVTIVPNKTKASPWLIYHSDYVCESMSEVVTLIKGLE